MTGSEATSSTESPSIGWNARSVSSAAEVVSLCTQLVSFSPPAATYSSTKSPTSRVKGQGPRSTARHVQPTSRPATVRPATNQAGLRDPMFQLAREGQLVLLGRSGTDEIRSHGRSHQRRRQVHAAETRLLYDNAFTGIVATVVIAAVLAYAQREIRPHAVIVAWLLYVLMVSAARYTLLRRYRRESPGDIDSPRWSMAFAVGAATAAAGWVVAAIVLYAPDEPMNQAFLVFVVGGVMLGGASLLAPRPEAFLTFLLPTGLATALRLAIEGDEAHLMMGFLAATFTAATVTTTWRFHRVIESSLQLRFDNQDLIDGLQAAKDQADAVNRELEQRVRERTAMLTDADQRKNEFLATLAHELRNPLAPIRFAVESLKFDAPPQAAARARDVIERQVRQLVRLVDDLLDVSRITANKIQLRREPHDLARLMETAVESVMPLASAAEQTLEVRAAVNADPCSWRRRPPGADLHQRPQQRGEVHASRGSHPVHC
jgi:signal transduction histidine kinase